ncbi:TPA: hypothetical protein ACHVH4_002270, partial [Streptococcus suis]
DGELPSYKDYKNLRDQLIIPVFGINTSACLDSFEVRHQIINKITHQIFSLNLSDESSSLTVSLIYALLDAKVATKYFYGPSNNYSTDQYNENLRFIDNIGVNRLNEINFDDYGFSPEVFEEIGSNPNYEYLNYQNILFTDENSAELITYDSMFGLNLTNDSSHVTNLEIIKSNETDYIVTFDFNDYEGQYPSLSNFFFKVDIIHYVDTEIWETYIADSFRNYHNGNHKLAFLLAFIAIESYIENIIYTIRTNLLPETVCALYYGQYGSDWFTKREVQYLLSEVPDEGFENHTNQLRSERKGLDDILWYVNLYRDFLNDHRNLTEDKLKDIIKMISQLTHIKDYPTDLSIIDFGQVFGEDKCIENTILHTLTSYSKIRNKLAHGSELDEEERNFHHLYSNLIIVFASLVEYLNGKKLF